MKKILNIAFLCASLNVYAMDREEIQKNSFSLSSMSTQTGSIKTNYNKTELQKLNDERFEALKKLYTQKEEDFKNKTKHQFEQIELIKKIAQTTNEKLNIVNKHYESIKLHLLKHKDLVNTLINENENEKKKLYNSNEEIEKLKAYNYEKELKEIDSQKEIENLKKHLLEKEELVNKLKEENEQNNEELYNKNKEIQKLIIDQFEQKLREIDSEKEIKHLKNNLFEKKELVNKLKEEEEQKTKSLNIYKKKIESKDCYKYLVEIKKQEKKLKEINLAWDKADSKNNKPKKGISYDEDILFLKSYIEENKKEDLRYNKLYKENFNFLLEPFYEIIDSHNKTLKNLYSNKYFKNYLNNLNQELLNAGFKIKEEDIYIIFSEILTKYRGTIREYTKLNNLRYYVIPKELSDLLYECFLIEIKIKENRR
jgi:hypothetical protein